ncbi:MAG: DUF805 domain-containing protein [Planctomycetota bacterium]
MGWFMTVVKQRYAQFDGRASRSEYWFFVLFQFIAVMAANVIDMIMVGVLGFPIFAGLIVSLGLLCPSIAVGIRRLHDIGKPGIMILLGLIPCVGLILIYWFIQPSQEGANEFGPPAPTAP